MMTTTGITMRRMFTFTDKILHSRNKSDEDQCNHRWREKKKSLILLPEFKDFKFTTAVMRQTRERFWNPSHKQLTVREKGDTLKSLACDLKLHKLLLMHLCSLKINQNCRGITVGVCDYLADENDHRRHSCNNWPTFKEEMDAKLLLFPWY